MTECNCPLAKSFMCPRHNVMKSAQLQKLCKTRPDYFKAWEEGRGPGQFNTPGMKHLAERKKKMEAEKNKVGRRLWLSWHRYTQDGEWNPNQAKEWYVRWKEQIPAWGCSCKRDYAKIEAQNMPVFHTEEAFVKHGFKIHNLVNKKLNRPEYPLEKAWQDRLGFLKGERENAL